MSRKSDERRRALAAEHTRKGRKERERLENEVRMFKPGTPGRAIKDLLGGLRRGDARGTERARRGFWRMGKSQRRAFSMRGPRRMGAAGLPYDAKLARGPAWPRRNVAMASELRPPGRRSRTWGGRSA